MSISQDIIDSVKDRVNIVELISEYVNLKRSGKNYKGLCPFHNEKTPSFVVNEEKGIFHCFGCGAGGNVFTFLMKIKGISFPEAVKLLASRVGIKVDDSSDQRSSYEQNIRKKYYDINRKVAIYYHKNLYSKTGEKALNYLHNRGITDTSIKEFGLGYAPDSWDGIIKFAGSRGITTEELLKIGLIVEKNRGNGYYDRFRNRIMFPIRDSIGRVIGFGGRILPGLKPDGKNDDIPKYINTNDNDIFHKGKNLYGFYVAEDCIRRENAVFIVEGYLDVIKMHQAGIKNVVAPLGTALTEDQAKFLLRYTKNVYLSFDPDEAGFKAALRSVSMFHSLGIDPRIIRFPEGVDPADFFEKYNIEDFDLILKDSISGVNFLIYHFKPDNSKLSAQDKLSLIEKVFEYYSFVKDPLLREDYINTIATAVNLTTSTVMQEFDNLEKSHRNKQYIFSLRGESKSLNQLTQNERAISEIRSIIKKELYLLLLIMNNPEYYDIAGSRLNSNHFIGKWTKYLWNLISELAEKGNLTVSSVLSRIEDESFVQYLSGKIFDERLNTNPKDQIIDLIFYLKEKEIRKRMEEINNNVRIAELENDERLLSELITEKQVLRNELEKLKNFREKKALIG